MVVSNGTDRIDLTSLGRFRWFDLDGVAVDEERVELRAMEFGGQGEEA